MNNLYNNEMFKDDLLSIVDNVPNIEDLKNSRILITGATGMLAQYIVNTFVYLNEYNDFNIVIYALGRNKSKLERVFNHCSQQGYFVPIVQDVNEEWGSDFQFDYVIHAASSASAESIANYPVDVLKANLIGTLNMMENILKFSADTIRNTVFLSTREIYGDVEKNLEVVEESTYGKIDSLSTRSSYPLSKKMAENIFKSYSYQYDLPFTITRLAHIYGPGMQLNDGRIMSDIIGGAVNKEDIVLVSDGQTFRSICYITDAISGILIALLDKNINNTYNISNEDEPIKIIDIAKTAAEYAGVDVITKEISKEEHSKKYSTMRTVPLDTNRLESMGWKKLMTNSKGIKRTIRIMREGENRNEK